MKIYDPRQYWQQRGLAYYVRQDSADELEAIRLMLERLQPANILEVGSGWGRMYQHLAKHSSSIASNFRMCDFVESMLDGCEQKTGIRPDLWDGQTLPYADDSFDVVLSIAVLQHVPPANLDGIFAEHVRVSRQWLYVTALIRGAGKRVVTTWGHRYGSLFTGLVDVVEMTRWHGGKQIIKGEWGRAHWLLRKQGNLS